MPNAESGGSPPPRDVPVDWEALEDAFENNAPEVHSYLHLGTGEVLRVVDGIADPEMHARIAADATYMRIDPVSSREQYRWMERFIQMIEEPILRDDLVAAIDGKGAFRRFKDVLMTHATERERWFAFRSERLRVFMEAWLSAHALNPVQRTAWPAKAPAEEEEASAAATVEPVAARRGRSADGVRRQIREVIDAMGARDLEKVLAFAEFVRVRRSTRTGYAQRADASGTYPAEPSAGESAETPDPQGDREEPPSSRRRSAAK